MRQRVLKAKDVEQVGGRWRVKRGAASRQAGGAAGRTSGGPRTGKRGDVPSVSDGACARQATSPLSFVLTGRMVSGKNQVTVTRTGHRFPNARFVAWRESCSRQVLEQVPMDRVVPPVYAKSQRVSLTVAYHPGDKIRRDAPGMIDALCHLLERCGIIEDDAQIKEVEWKELPLDRQHPRVTVTLTHRA